MYSTMHSTSLNMSEGELYNKLLKYLLPENNLDGYPTPDPYVRGSRKVPLSPPVRNDFAGLRYMICGRCKSEYQVNPKTGMPVMHRKECKYHPRGVWECKHLCCGRSDPMRMFQCSSNAYHVQEGVLLMANYKGFVETQLKPEKEPNKHGIYPLDCEMCYTTVGKELTRVTVLNHNSDVVYEKLVKPKNPVLDYNTKTSGIKPEDLDYVTTTLEDVQRDLLKLFSSKSILIGHSLEHDMLALKLFHKRFIDTSRLYVHPNGLRTRYRLAELAEKELGVTIQKGSGHDSKEDAVTAFRLVLKKLDEDQS